MANADHVYEEIRRRNPFDEFRIIRERLGVWYCGKVGTCNLSFRVVTAPGLLMLYGDIGEIIFLPNDRHALRWAYGETFNPEFPYYPLTKLSPQMREKEFLVDEVDAYLKDKIKECRKDGDKEGVAGYIKLARAWKDRCTSGNSAEDQLTWYDLCSDHGYDEPPSCTDFPCRTYWCFHAMCWFMSQVNPEDPRFAEEMKP